MDIVLMLFLISITTSLAASSISTQLKRIADALEKDEK